MSGMKEQEEDKEQDRSVMDVTGRKQEWVDELRVNTVGKKGVG